MGRIQRYAEGFLSLVGNKVGGREPTQLSDVVMPTVDMTELLKGRTLSVEVVTMATSAYGDTQELTVPDNEIWLLRGVSWSVLSLNVNDLINLLVYVTELPGSSSPTDQAIILGPELNGVGATPTHTIIRAATFDTPFVLTPGSVIGWEICDTSNNTRTWNGKAVFYRLSA